MTQDEYPATLYAECAARAKVKASLGERDWREARSQRAYVTWLRAFPACMLHPMDWFHIRNEAKLTKRQAGQVKNSGIKAGAVDLMIARPGLVNGYRFGALWIELKRPDRSNKATPEQLEFIERRRLWGDVAEVCYGHHEAIELTVACYGW